MAKKGSLTKILAVVGTVLVWIPVLAPILFEECLGFWMNLNPSGVVGLKIFAM